ncbi:MAG: ketopantoate reductase family protein [Candidatus Binatia bacterium]
MDRSSAPRVLVMGCGGIGGTIAGHLVEHGVETVVVTHNPAIADAINQRGFQLRGADAARAVPGRATAALPPDAGQFDFVFLTTQPPQVVGAAQAAAPLLRPGGAVVCFQNGLCEEHVAPVVGAEQVIGAIVVWGGSMPEPGVYDRTSEGGFVLGRLDGADDQRFAALRALLAPIGAVETTRNLAGARWSKLAINCAISSLGTIGGRRLGELMRYRFVRRLGLEVMTEAVVVAQRAGVRLEKVSGTLDLGWIALTPADVGGAGSPTLLAKHALLLAVGAKYRRLRSSMLIAIERGREPAVDFLNGEVVRRASELDIPVPINRRVQDTIGALWRRECRPSVRLLRALYEESRRETYAATANRYGGGGPHAAA